MVVSLNGARAVTSKDQGSHVEWSKSKVSFSVNLVS